MLGVRSLRNQCERSAISSSVLGIGPRQELSLRPRTRALSPRKYRPRTLQQCSLATCAESGL